VSKINLKSIIYIFRNKLNILAVLVFVFISFLTFFHNTNAQVITADETWTASSTPYIINNLTIQNGATLTIKEGAVLKMNVNSYINIYGTLNIQGSLENKVYISSIKNDSIMGDTNGDGEATSPAAGDWGNLNIFPGGFLNMNNTELNYGGKSVICSYLVNCLGSVFNYGGDVNISNSKIQDSENYGVYSKTGSTDIGFSDIDANTIAVYSSSGSLFLNNNFIHNAVTGVRADTLDSLVIKNNIFSENNADVYLSSLMQFEHENNKSLSGNLKGFYLAGHLKQNTVSLTKDKMPYIIGRIIVDSKNTLNIEKGSVLKFYNINSRVENKGTLNIKGTETEKVFLTSIKDDSIMGDTNGDGEATSPAAGDWGNIRNLGGLLNINNANISFGGYTQAYECGYYTACAGAISNIGGSLNIQNSEIQKNKNYNIFQKYGSANISFSKLSSSAYSFYAVKGTANLNQNNIHNNSSGGVGNFFSNPNIINAKNNYWGDPSGPYHPTLNPAGLGDRVTDYVDFSNWLESPNISLPSLSYSEEKGYNSDQISQGIKPNKGTASSTKFTFKVLYQNKANKAPTYINLVVSDGTNTQTFPMIQDTTTTSTPQLYDNDFTNKEQYIYQDIAQKGKYQYHFEASDGITTVRLPEIGELGFEVINTPVVIVPGILGSYLNRNDNEKTEVWLNLFKMVGPNDKYLDDLLMSYNGVSLINIVTSNIIRKISFLKAEKDFFDGIINELTNDKYKENEDLFTFPYDWRLNNIYNTDLLKDKISQIRNDTGVNEVDIIAHSMGGFLAKQYIKNTKGEFVRKFIDIATPHLGAPKAFKILSFGDNLNISILNSSRVKTITQNFPSIYQLLPSRQYFDPSNSNYNYYFYDSADIDNNGVKGKLNYDQTMEFLKNTGRNSYLLGFNNTFHNNLDNWNAADYGVQTTNIVGCGEPTIGKIFTLNKETSGGYEYALSYITGDQTVPLRSAETLFGAEKTYYVNGTAHSQLPSVNGVKQLVASLLIGQEFNIASYSNLTEDKSNCSFSGKAISFHSPVEMHIYDENNKHTGPTETGDIENNLEGVTYDIIDGNKFAFLPDGKNYTIKVKATDTGTFNARIKIIKNEKVTQTQYFNQIPLTTLNTNAEIDMQDNQTSFTIQIDQDGDDIFEENIQPSSTLDENQSQDITKPKTEISIKGKKGNNDWHLSNVQITLNAIDDNSGILKTEYSINNGDIWNTYQNPFTISQEGETTILFKSTDKAGNIETEKEIMIKIDKTAPEARIYFDKDKLTLKVEGIDNLTKNPKVSIIKINKEEDKDDKKEEKHERKHHKQTNKQNIIYKIEDEAGNIASLSFKKLKQERKEIKTALKSIKYNDKLIKFPKNEIEYKWSLNKKNDTIKTLKQKLKVKKEFTINARYTNKITRLGIKEQKGKREKLILKEMIIVKLKTNKGKLTYEFK